MSTTSIASGTFSINSQSICSHGPDDGAGTPIFAAIFTSPASVFQLTDVAVANVEVGRLTVDPIEAEAGRAIEAEAGRGILSSELARDAAAVSGPAVEADFWRTAGSELAPADCLRVGAPLGISCCSTSRVATAASELISCERPGFWEGLP